MNSSAPYQLLPPLSPDDYAALEDSIVASGVLVPVEYDEAGNILDGHHRVQICESLGLIDWPRFVRKGLSEAEKRAHARALNLSRRHLSTAQKREVIEAQLMEEPTISSRAIAARLGVSKNTVSTVRQKLIDGGQIDHHAELVGKDGVAQPARKPIRTMFLPEKANVREMKQVVKQIRTAEMQHSRDVRTDLINEIAKKGKLVAGEMPVAAYAVGYADPPWEQEAWSDETGQDKGLRYPPMPLDDIKALCAGDKSPFTRDAKLYLWVPTNRVDDGVDVLRAWGFDFVSMITWDKVHIGMGREVRDRTEHLLIGKRGNFPGLIMGTQTESLFAEVKGGHSRKPLWFPEQIDRLYPDMRKLELFQRKASLADNDIRRNGLWDFWGFEAGDDKVDPIAESGDSIDDPADLVDENPDSIRLPKLPPGPGKTATVEFSVGGMRKGSFARFGVCLNADGSYSISAEYEIAGLCGGSSPQTGKIANFESALRHGLAAIAGQLRPVITDPSSVCTKSHRACARAGMKWIESKYVEWGIGATCVTHSAESEAA
ncbi:MULTISPECIES: Spo0J and IME4 domain-containing protein [unclassified Rhizobium]